MIKIIPIALVIAVFPYIAIAQNGSSNSNGNSNSSGSSASVTSTVQSQNQQENQAQVQTNNPGIGTQSQTQTQSQERIQSPTASTTHTPVQLRQNSSVQNRSEVASAVQSLIQSSYQIENKGLGEQIRTIAQTHSQNNQSIDSAIDKASNRSGFAKFLIGPNYKELKSAKQLMEQNRLQIQNLEQTLAAVTNEADAQNLMTQLEILNQQQTSLQNDLGSFTKGFALFGWLNRLINNY